MSRLLTHYLLAGSFRKYAVFQTYRHHEGFDKWLVCGPGLKWMGEPFHTHEEALDYVKGLVK